MGWNRNHAARLLHGQERALFEASLPDRATGMSESELRASAKKLRRTLDRHAAAGDGEPKAQMLGEALLRVEKEAERRKLSGPETQTAPRAGRTGGMGSRAERPSEGRHRTTTQKQVEPGRSSKAPSATTATSAKSGAGQRSDKPQARKSRSQRSEKPQGQGDKLPEPVRDSTN